MFRQNIRFDALWDSKKGNMYPIMHLFCLFSNPQCIRVLYILLFTINFIKTNRLKNKNLTFLLMLFWPKKKGGFHIFSPLHIYNFGKTTDYYFDLTSQKTNKQTEYYIFNVMQAFGLAKSKYHTIFIIKNIHTKIIQLFNLTALAFPPTCMARNCSHVNTSSCVDLQ